MNRFKFMRGRGRAISALALSLIMSASLGVSSLLNNKRLPITAEAAEALESGVTFEDVTGKVNLNSVALRNLSPAAIKGVADTKANAFSDEVIIVSLAGESLSGGAPDGVSVADYAQSPEGKAHAAAISAEHDKLFAELASLKINYNLKYEYNAVINAVAIEVNPSYAAAIKAIDGVTSVVGTGRYNAPQMQASLVSNGSTDEIFTTGIYDSGEFTSQGYIGKNVSVAILDTGLDYTHEAFDMEIADEDAAFTRADIDNKIAVDGAKFAASDYLAANGEVLRANDVYISSKVPFAFDYADSDTDVYPSYSQHGTHVAGIVAGSADSYTDKEGHTVKRENENGDLVDVPFRGVAPGAQLVICKVFTDDTEDVNGIGGAVTEDLVAALNDCVLLGVDVINMSLGTSCGFSEIQIDGDTEGDLLNECYNNVDKAGISLLAAASNDFSAGYGGNFGTNLASNPDSGTVGSPSTYTTSLSVASINGQLSPYIVANATDTDEGSIIYFENSSDANSVQFDFVNDILGDATKQTFNYVLVPGYGRSNDYSAAVLNVINSFKDKGEKVIVVVKRGANKFSEKVEIAMSVGADAIVVYNNVSGRIRMSLGEVEDPIPAISVSMDAGTSLEHGTYVSGVMTGTITVDRTGNAGPFMNDYSSWGVTPDLKLKPEVTIYGGEIISTVAGGYQEMSGTSMATPNMAGLVAVALDYLHDHEAEYSNLSALSEKEKKGGYTDFVNQLAMSTGVIVYDENDLPVSPRKQGAGLVSLVNMLASKVYLSNPEADKNRPKAELGDDKERTGRYEFTFNLNNISGGSQKYTLGSEFMTETLAQDGLTVAERAYMLEGNAEYTIDGSTYKDGDTVTFAAGTTEIKVVLTLTADEKNYIDTSFVNGMFVEGFIRLKPEEGSKNCEMSLPFVGYYGAWENPNMPLLDMDAYTAAEYEKDKQYNDDTRPKPSVWGTQAYGRYYGGAYSIPLGSFMYLQDEDVEQIYADPEHVALSCFDSVNYDDPTGDYSTAYAIRGLYAGLLRNAELCVYTVTNVDTGEVILEKEGYRIGKARTGGGSTVPAYVEMNLSPSELGLASNGKYAIDFQFYFHAKDREEGIEAANSKFSMTFYVDYEAPILQDSKLRYYNYKEENGVEKQRVYLDLYVYDNHYAQSALLCYADTDKVTDTTQLKLATEYVTPVYNAVKNGTTLVTIEVTDFIEKYSNRLYVQVDDYALNHTVYKLNITDAKVSVIPDDYSLAAGEENVTLKVGEAHTVALENIGDADLSNFIWTSNAQRIAKVENGTIVGVAPGKTTVTVSNFNKDNGNSEKGKYTINVTVTEERQTGTVLSEISFGTILANNQPVKAKGVVEVTPGQKFTLEVETEPWYFDMQSVGYVVRFASSNPNYATVDENGAVTVKDYEWYEEGGKDENGKTHKRGDVKSDPTGTAIITATVYREVINGSGEKEEIRTAIYTAVTLLVRDSFRVTNMSLSSYDGTAREVWIPNDRNITQIGAQAFRDCHEVEVIHVPKTVATIEERAFEGCINLREVIFEDSDSSDEIHDSALNMIYRYAFSGLNKLEVVDFTNCRSVTIAREAFSRCPALKEVRGAETVTTIGARAFAECTALTYMDISSLHSCGAGAFVGCTGLKRITTARFTEIGDGAFYGCTSLTETGASKDSAADASFTIKGARVGVSAFENGALTSVTFENPRTVIGDNAFRGNYLLDSVTFAEGSGVVSIGKGAFSDCIGLTSITVPNSNAEIGENDCEILGSDNFVHEVLPYYEDEHGNRYSLDKKTLISVASTATSIDLTGVEAIAPLAFSNAKMLYELVVPASVTELGEMAFAFSMLDTCDLSATSLKALPAYAFAGSLAISEVKLPVSVTEIGEYAFGRMYDRRNVSYSCDSLKNFDFSNIVAIGAYAFGYSGLENAEFSSNLKEIGEGAFYATKLSKAAIPASAEKIGEGAFSRVPTLGEITVAEGNANFFVKGGALYRTISEGRFELLAYPGGLVASDGKFVVPDGTVSIASSAFEGLRANALSQVEIAYTVKVIGEAAFFESGITTYYFNAITAPTLLAQVDYKVLNATVVEDMLSYRGMFYNNFQEYLYPHVGDVFGDYTVTDSRLTIYAPENGVGYDNYVFTHYFGRKVSLGVLINDETRAIKTSLEDLDGKLQLVQSWAADSFAVNETNRAEVEALVRELSAIHAGYLAITDADQLGFIGAELVDNLGAVEAALRPVKAKFGISSQIKSIEFVKGSAKTEYKVGEKLDLDGLKVLITYDDFSTEERTLNSGDYTFGAFSTQPDVALTEYDTSVELNYGTNVVYITISVTAEGGTGGDGPGGEIIQPAPSGNLGLIIGLSVGGGLIVLAAAGVLVVMLLTKKKRGVYVEVEETKEENGEDGNENS